jgi:hypothetical protein
LSGAAAAVSGAETAVSGASCTQRTEYRIVFWPAFMLTSLPPYHMLMYQASSSRPSVALHQ